MLAFLAVGAGGFVGAGARYLVGLVPLGSQGGFPIATFAVNLLGSFAIGILAGLSGRLPISPNLLLFLRVGFCGGFTTFSTFSLETLRLLQGGQTAIAVCYGALSLVLGVAAAYLGLLLAR